MELEESGTHDAADTVTIPPNTTATAPTATLAPMAAGPPTVAAIQQVRDHKSRIALATIPVDVFLVRLGFQSAYTLKITRIHVAG